MSRKRRRIKPSSRADRKRVAELNGILGNPRKSRDEKAAALAELNTLAPYADESGSPVESGSSSPASIIPKEAPAKPATKDILALCDRVDARRKADSGELLSDVDWRVHVPGLAKEAPLVRRCTLLAADFQVRVGSARECFSSAERMHELFLTGEFTLADMDVIEAAFLTRYGQLPTSRILPARAECRDNKYSGMQKKALEFFRSRSADEQKRLRGVFGAGPLTPALNRLAETLRGCEIAAAPTPEACFAEDETAAPHVSPERLGTPNSAVERADEPKQDPIARASLDLNARAEAVLNTDSWLSNLGTHNGGAMRDKIVEAITQQLVTTGFADALFCSKLYNTLRPRGLSRFPERRF